MGRLLRFEDEIDLLPNGSVVEDHGKQIWQKIMDREQGVAEAGYGYVWFSPGCVDGHQSTAIRLPATLLT